MAQIDTTNLDAGTDKIKLARPALLAIAQFVNKLLGYTTDDITDTEKTAARTVLDVPTKGGSGAGGTWGISINGNANTVSTLTTAQVLAATAGASAGAVGTFALAQCANAIALNAVTFGSTVAGSNLVSASAGGLTDTTLLGTWRNMGYAFPAFIGATPADTVTLWLRIS